MNKENLSPEIERRKAKFAALAASYNEWEDDSYLSKNNELKLIDQVAEAEIQKVYPYSNKEEIQDVYPYSNKVVYDRPGSKSNTPKKKKDSCTNLNTPHKYLPSATKNLKYTQTNNNVTPIKEKPYNSIYPHLDNIATPSIGNLDLELIQAETTIKTVVDEKITYLAKEKAKLDLLDMSTKSEEDFKLTKQSPNTMLIEFKKPITTKNDGTCIESDIIATSNDSCNQKKADENFVQDKRNREGGKGKKIYKLRDENEKIELKNTFTRSVESIMCCERENDSSNPIKGEFKNRELSSETPTVNLQNNMTSGHETCKTSGLIGEGESDDVANNNPIHRNPALPRYDVGKGVDVRGKDILADPKTIAVHSPEWTDVMEKFRNTPLLRPNRPQQTVDQDKVLPAVTKPPQDSELYSGNGQESSLEDAHEYLGSDEEEEEELGITDHIFLDIKAKRMEDLKCLSSFGIVSSVKKDITTKITSQRDGANMGTGSDVKNSNRQAEMEALVKRWEKVSTSPSTNKKVTFAKHYETQEGHTPKAIIKAIPLQTTVKTNSQFVNNNQVTIVQGEPKEEEKTPRPDHDITNVNVETVCNEIDYDDTPPGEFSILMADNKLDLSLRLSDFHKITEKFGTSPSTAYPNPKDHHTKTNQEMARRSPETDDFVPQPNKLTPNFKINKIITYDYQPAPNTGDQSYRSLTDSPVASSSPLKDRDEEINLTKNNAQTYADKIKELTREVEHQQSIIGQVSQALMICRQQKKQAFCGSQEQIEAEKLNFIARQKRQVLLAEIHRLKEEEVRELKKIQNRPSSRKTTKPFSPLLRVDDNSSKANGFLNISNIRLPLKPEVLENNGNQGFIYHFLCLFKYGTNLVLTQLATLDNTSLQSSQASAKKNAINFNNCINIHGVRDEWVVDLEVYTMYIKKDGVSGVGSGYSTHFSSPSTHSLFSSPRHHKGKDGNNTCGGGSGATQAFINRFTPHRKKQATSSKNPGNDELSWKNAGGPSQNSTSTLAGSVNSPLPKDCKESQAQSYTNDQSNFSDAGVFVLSGFTCITKSDSQNRTRNFALKKVPNSSPLQGIVLLNLKCHAHINHRGYLNMFEVLGGLGSWSRRWFVLNGQYLSYWKYPEHETSKAPLNSIDLSACVNRVIESVRIEVCARPNTLSLDVLDHQGVHDRSIMGGSTFEERYPTHRYLLSADNKEQLQTWCQVLTKALSFLNTWERNFPKTNFNSLSSAV